VASVAAGCSAYDAPAAVIAGALGAAAYTAAGSTLAAWGIDDVTEATPQLSSVITSFRSLFLFLFEGCVS